MLNDDLQILQRIRDRVAKHWTQGEYARAADGTPIYSNDPAACSWCLAGAINKESYTNGVVDYDLRLRMLMILNNEYGKDIVYYGYSNLTSFNDAKGRTLDEVLAYIDAAIQRATNSGVETNAIPSS